MPFKYNSIDILRFFCACVRGSQFTGGDRRPKAQVVPTSTNLHVSNSSGTREVAS